MDLSDATLPGPFADAIALHEGGDVSLQRLREQPHRFALDHLAVLRVTGRDRVRFLHAMLSNDVQSLKPGQGTWATFNTVQGRTVSDLRLFVVDDDRKTGSILLLVERDARDALVDGLEKYVISEKVFFEDSGLELHLLAGGRLDDLRPERLYDHREAQLGAPVRLVHLDRSGPSGDVGVFVASEHEAAFLERVADYPEGTRALLEAARLSAGMPRFGVDFGPKNIPLEAGLSERAIHFSKGCYIGQEVICRLDSMGTPAKRLVRLEGSVAPGDDLSVGGKVVGWVTTAGTVDGRALALGYVKKRFNAPGTELQAGEAKVLVGESV
jgi:folate-binding protein YgfZ